MARYRGSFTVAANYEPLTASPFDARELVECKADLTDEHTWTDEEGEIWIYEGMLVTVAHDSEPENNGTYRLAMLPYSSVESWVKQADETDIAHLQAQIDGIESGTGSISVEIETLDDLPPVGDDNTTYYVKEAAAIYRWDEEAQSYISYGGTGDFSNITIIHGGDANGTN